MHFNRRKGDAAQTVGQFLETTPGLFFKACVCDRSFVGASKTVSEQLREMREVACPKPMAEIAWRWERFSREHANAESEDVIIPAGLCGTAFGVGGFNLYNFQAEIGVTDVSEFRLGFADNLGEKAFHLIEAVDGNRFDAQNTRHEDPPLRGNSARNTLLDDRLAHFLENREYTPPLVESRLSFSTQPTGRYDIQCGNYRKVLVIPSS
jgi:hypothetical protein